MKATDRILYLSARGNPIHLNHLYETACDHALHLQGMAQLAEHVLTKSEGVLPVNEQGCITLIRDTLRRIGKDLDDNVCPETFWTERAFKDGFANVAQRLQEGQEYLAKKAETKKRPKGAQKPTKKRP